MELTEMDYVILVRTVFTDQIVQVLAIAVPINAPLKEYASVMPVTFWVMTRRLA